MKWMKLWIDEMYHGSFFQMSFEERGFFVSLLVMAAKGDDKGKIQIRDGVGIPMESLALQMNSSVDNVGRILKDLEKRDMISVGKSGDITIVNWVKYQDDYQRYQAARDTKILRKYSHSESKNHLKIASESSKSPDVDVDVDGDGEVKPIYASVFEHWNHQQIIVHKVLTDKMKGKINALKKQNATEAEIIASITHYKKVLDDPQCFFKYKWTLDEFLARGFERFKDYKIALNNFQKKKSPSSGSDRITGKGDKYDTK